MKKNTAIVVIGPTGVGKTAVAIALARHFNTEIISSDSRQCFKELNIGVARPSAEELSTATHHFIASHSIFQEVTAVSFEEYALKKINSIFEKSPIAIVAGGTGLYIRAFCEGFDPVPHIPPEIRSGIITAYEKNGIEWLQNELQLKDPEYLQNKENKNPQRLMRALEVVMATGNSILNYQQGMKKQRDFNIIKIGIEEDKQILYDKINRRVDAMMHAGLEAEAKSLLPQSHLNALQTVGYTELFEYFNQITTLHAAVEKIKQHTRNYAKRQMTWFKKDGSVQWFKPGDIETMLQYVGSV